MAQPNTISICQLNCNGIQAGMETITRLLAILHRYNFEIKPVNFHPGCILYVCIHRGLGVDPNPLNQEMMIHNTPVGKKQLYTIQWTFA
ncbi:unnamed protein product [Adineta steineri]|uniref:Uncharacterized protein n=1 Tax=Adineta steineri TaxID=433720 RepID=A0A815MC27_9BILA|nr:unnamed protein product [Adineta steineri]CAF1422137.1 unnamed protein product [Adineta steineri]